MISVPPVLDWWRHEPGGAAWLDRLPGIVAEVVAEWGLDLEAPFELASDSYVCPCRLADGVPAVLKINFPEPESEHEGTVLRRWGGSGAVRLLDVDEARGALLLERCEPGTSLWAVEPETDVGELAIAVLATLWQPARPGHAYRLLADEAARWIEELPLEWVAYRRPYPRGLLHWMVAFLEEAGQARAEQVVLHGDLHGGNVLRGGDGWVAIDPKPLVGERDCDPGWLLADRVSELARDPAPAARIRRRLDRVCDVPPVDRARVPGWGIAHLLAWGVWEGAFDARAVTCATWLHEAAA